MIVKHWPVAFTAGYGHELPRTYCCFDLETSGFDRKCDVILEFGHVLVVDGEIVDELSVLLDWRGHHIVSESWLRQRIADLRQKLSDKGVAHHLPWERLCAEGINPEKAMGFYRDFFAKLKDQGTPVVGHNVYRFDEPFLEANLVGFQMCDEFRFGDWQLWDTMSLEAATVAGPANDRAIPRPGQTLRDWMTKASYIKAETNLTRTLVKRYNLVAKYGLNTLDSHSACYDARLCHYLMQEYHAMLEAEPEPEPVKLAAVPLPGRTPAPPPLPAGRPKGRVPGDQPSLFDQIDNYTTPEVVYGDPTRRRRQRNR